MNFNDKKIALILTGGIACYKVLDLIRALKKQGAHIVPIMTQGAKEFITPMSVASLSQSVVHDELWSLKDEVEIGHIQLARDCDMVLVAPATANFIAKTAHGLADDLASTVLLATDKPILYVPAMNPHMYANCATQDNMALLQKRGAHFVEPDHGVMACNEEGLGRYPEQDKILSEISKCLELHYSEKLKDKTILITLGATQEEIDPVRFISNHSSGKQGLAIAETLRRQGANIILLKANTTVSIPDYFISYETRTAEAMAKKAEQLLKSEKIDVAICVAAICDWRLKNAHQKKLKKGNGDLKNLDWVENPDILALISNHKKRPKCVIGFAAETNDIIEHAKKKLAKKGCDFILYNDVGKKDVDVGFGSEYSEIGYCSKNTTEAWGRLKKHEIAQKIAQIIEK